MYGLPVHVKTLHVHVRLHGAFLLQTGFEAEKSVERNGAPLRGEGAFLLLKEKASGRVQHGTQLTSKSSPPSGQLRSMLESCSSFSRTFLTGEKVSRVG